MNNLEYMFVFTVYTVGCVMLGFVVGYVQGKQKGAGDTIEYLKKRFEESNREDTE